MKIGLFGGIFDPPHLGHIKLALEIIKLRKVEEILFVPSKNSHNLIKKKNMISSYDRRVDMLKIAIRGMNYLNVSEIENNFHSNIVFTIDVVDFFIKKYPKDSFSIIIGLDNLQYLHKWKNSNRLIEDYEFIIYDRDVTFDIKKILEYWPRKLAQKILNSIIMGKKFLISSEKIKDLIRKHEKIDYKIIDKNVLDYILNSKLY